MPSVLLFHHMYTIISWKEAGVWSVMSPSVSGVFGLGRTREVAERNFSDALRTLLDYLKEIGEPAPRSNNVFTSTVRV